MAAKIHELRAAREKVALEANAALVAARDKAKAEGRALTPDEIKAQDEFDAKLKASDDEIEIEERLLDRERRYGSAAPARDVTATVVPGSGLQRVEVGAHNSAKDPRRGFASPREFLSVVMDVAMGNEADERVKALIVRDKDDKAAGEPIVMLPRAFTPSGLLATAGSDEQGEYDNRYGGFAVPGPTRLPGVLAVGFEGDPTAGLTQPIPMATPSVEIMARVDKDHTTSVSGGFTVARKAETVALSGSRGSLEMITMKASSMFGMAYATEELLQDSPQSFIAIIDSGLRTEFGAQALKEKLRGKGGDQFLGILTALAASSLGPTISIAKEAGQVADTIVAENVIKMAARSWGYGNSIWLANHDTRPQLMRMYIAVGTSGWPLYQVQNGFPDSLMGRPIFYTEFANTVGDQGDVMLCNWSQFLEGLYQPLQSAESVHVRFLNHERAFKLWLRNAGAPWWRSALTPAKSSATLSPFVVLDAR